MITNLPADKKIRTWRNYSRDNVALCYCCNQNIITDVNFEVALITPIAMGGKSNISNLKPVCTACQYDIGSYPIINCMRIKWQPYYLRQSNVCSAMVCHGLMMREYIIMHDIQGYDMMDVDRIYCSLHATYCS
jgi:hypothetical protein